MNLKVWASKLSEITESLLHLHSRDFEHNYASQAYYYHASIQKGPHHQPQISPTVARIWSRIWHEKLGLGVQADSHRTSDLVSSHE